MRTKTQPKNSPPSPLLDQAHNLLRAGKRAEARDVVVKLIELEPANKQAIALRDRIDSEEFRTAVVRQRQTANSLFQFIEDEDAGPFLLLVLLLVGVACLIAGTWLAYKPLRYGFAHGFTTEVVAQNRWEFLGKGRYPVHYFLMHPVVLYLLAVICFYAYYRNKR
jgi:hypothetical protein